MDRLSLRTVVALTVAIGGGALGAMAACSSGSSVPVSESNSGSNSGGSSGSAGSGESSDAGGLDATVTTPPPFTDATLVTYDGPPPNVDGGKLPCDTPNAVPIQFNPMYSGFDGTHTYQLPTFVPGVDPASVTWGSSDPTMVAFAPYVTGIMITTLKAGDVVIVASVVNDAGVKTCGSAPLHITSYTPDEWSVGNARYNNGIGLVIDASAILATLKSCDAGIPADANIPSGFDGNVSGYDANFADFDGQAAVVACLGNPFDNPPAACTNCHGDVGNGKLFGMTLFTDVSHTPEQTGGFSDQDLVNVFVRGTVPDGGYFDNTIAPYDEWHDFHRWADIDTPEKQTGVTAYLRSLTPAEQLGCNDVFKKGGPGCDAGH
jgi:hypothetical protein